MPGRRPLSLLLMTPALAMVLALFVYPLGYSLLSAFATKDGAPASIISPRASTFTAPILSSPWSSSYQIARNPAPTLPFPAKSITSTAAYRQTSQPFRDSSRTTFQPPEWHDVPATRKRDLRCLLALRAAIGGDLDVCTNRSDGYGGAVLRFRRNQGPQPRLAALPENAMEWVDIATDRIGFPDGDHAVPGPVEEEQL